jgi:hypothetical protein
MHETLQLLQADKLQRQVAAQGVSPGARPAAERVLQEPASRLPATSCCSASAYHSEPLCQTWSCIWPANIWFSLQPPLQSMLVGCRAEQRGAAGKARSGIEPMAPTAIKRRRETRRIRFLGTSTARPATRQRPKNHLLSASCLYDFVLASSTLEQQRRATGAPANSRPGTCR